jgi:hypothetical protein
MAEKRHDWHGCDLIAVVAISLDDPKTRETPIKFVRWKQFALAWSVVLENADFLLCGDA